MLTGQHSLGQTRHLFSHLSYTLVRMLLGSAFGFLSSSGPWVDLGRSQTRMFGSWQTRKSLGKVRPGGTASSVVHWLWFGSFPDWKEDPGLGPQMFWVRIAHRSRCFEYSHQYPFFAGNAGSHFPADYTLSSAGLINLGQQWRLPSRWCCWLQWS